MPFGIGFMVLLMLVGGVAAYWGDRVGMIVGRRRLSIFGLRPKYTSRVVAVSTGVLIVLFTLVTLIIASNSVRQALFGMDELQAQIVHLSSEVTEFESKRVELESRNEQLLSRSHELEAETRQLEAEKRILDDEIVALEEQIEQTQLDLSRAQVQLSDLQENLEVMRFLGEQVFNVAQNLYGADFEVRAGEIIDTFLVDLRGGRSGIEERLRAALARTERSLVERGLGDGTDALYLDRIYKTDDGELISFNEDEVLAQAIHPLAQAAEEGYSSVIVQLIAVTNARSGDPVYADFHRFVRNERVFREGEVILERVFDPTQPRPAIFEAFMSFVQGEIAQIARAYLLPPDGVYGEMSFAQAYAAVDEISKYTDEVLVRATAARDTTAYDTLELEFEFSPLAGDEALTQTP